jgi:hypothetical protein
MRYQQFASHAYCGATGPVSKMAPQQKKASCVLRFEVFRSVITVQREFRHGFELLVALRATSSSNLDSCRCWRCTFCPCKERNEFIVNFWNCIILLWTHCISLYFASRFIHEFAVVLWIDADYCPNSINRLWNMIWILYKFCDVDINWIFVSHLHDSAICNLSDQMKIKQEYVQKTTHV